MTRAELEHLDNLLVRAKHEIIKEYSPTLDKAIDFLEIKMIEERPKLSDVLHTEQEPSGDLISRQAVIDAIMANNIWENEYNLTSSRIKKAVENLPSVNPQEPSVEILKTEESNDNGTKYLNINVSDGEVKRNPDAVRLCSDVGVLEYEKPKTGHWIDRDEKSAVCSCCNRNNTLYGDFCKWCGAKMVEPQEMSDKG